MRTLALPVLALVLTACHAMPIPELPERIGTAGASAAGSEGSLGTAAGARALPPPPKPLEGPYVVAIQAGHYQVDQMPDELARLRTNTGASAGGVREVDLNLAVAEALIPLIEARGWTAVFVPAAVPPRLQADAFVSLHADWGNTSARRGWKLAPPWRPSQASRALAQAVGDSFRAEPALVEDADGITVNMRGYYGFSWRRFENAIHPLTPAILLEMGFVTNPFERDLIRSRPQYFAELVMRGLETYFKDYSRRVEALQPLELPWVAAGPGGAVVRRQPWEGAAVVTQLEPGATIMPVDVRGEWYEVFVRPSRRIGWVHKEGLVNAADPRWPLPGEDNPFVSNP